MRRQRTEVVVELRKVNKKLCRFKCVLSLKC